MELKYFGMPPALRYLFFLAWRAVLLRVYEAHKALVLWREYSSHVVLIQSKCLVVPVLRLWLWLWLWLCPW
jgi:hypothetical protein